jgi:hypothetical protein
MSSPLSRIQPHSRVVPKWVKFIIGLVLLPVCVGGARALGLALRDAGPADVVWAPVLLGGAAWLSVYLLLPRPMWAYVLGHELTHAVWTWLFGGKVKKFKASSKGGQVLVTKNNFLISLAPYFFPFYAMAVAIVFSVGRLFWPWEGHRVWFHLLLGAAYAFHLTLTGHVLKTRQTDISQEGYLFSGVIIFLGNVLVLLFSVPLLTGTGRLLAALGRVFIETGHVFKALSGIF